MQHLITKLAALAKYCNVSASTASRVFSDAARVRSETREKVLAAAQKLGYNPIHSVHRDTVSIIVDDNGELDTSIGFTPSLALSLASNFYRSGYQPVISALGDRLAPPPNFLAATILLCWLCNQKSFFELSRLLCPVIAVNDESLTGIHSVSTDHVQGIKDAMNELYKHGHRRIVFLNPKPRNWEQRARQQGHEQFLSEHGMALNSGLICHGNSSGNLDSEEFRHALGMGATAVLCGQESWTMGVLQVLHQSGKSYPRDLSVIVSELPGICENLWPPVTAISQDLPLLSESLIGLVKTLKGNSAAKEAIHRIRLPEKLIRRQSIAAVSSQN